MTFGINTDTRFARNVEEEIFAASKDDEEDEEEVEDEDFDDYESEDEDEGD